MISHICIGITDFARANKFYAPIMARLGLTLRFSDANRPFAAWSPADQTRPLFFIGAPFDGKSAAPGNGNMTALLARDRPTVDACHALAMQNGGTSEGAPGLRAHYHPDYYAAYFRDPDGNKICVVCHDPV